MDIRIGKQLTQAREALGFVVEDVAHRTKIPASAIRQLESEDYSHFPNNVYAKSFLRLYSKFLQVDPRGYIDDKDGQLIPHEDEVAFLEGIAVGPEFQNLEEEEPERKISSGMITTVALVAIGVPTAIVLSNLYKSSGSDGGTAGGGQPPAVSPTPETGGGGSPMVPVDPGPHTDLVIAPSDEPRPEVPDRIAPTSVPPDSGETPEETPRALPVVEPDVPDIPTAPPVAASSDPTTTLSPPSAARVSLQE